MAPATAAFVILSAGQVAAICAITCASIALTWVLAIDEGRSRGRREQRELARQHGSDPLWLVRGEDDGE